MSKTKASFYVYGAPVSFLVECFRYRMARRVLSLSLPYGAQRGGHPALRVARFAGTAQLACSAAGTRRLSTRRIRLWIAGNPFRLITA